MQRKNAEMSMAVATHIVDFDEKNAPTVDRRSWRYDRRQNVIHPSLK
jgi:hypothetical protein